MKKTNILKKPIKVYTCDYCAKNFTNKSNKYRHQNYRCEKNLEIESKKNIDPTLISIIQQQNEKIDKLTQIVEDKTPVQNITNNNQITTTNNNHITIYLTEKVDFIKILTERFGDEQKAINFIKEKIAQKVDGDVDLFCEIYLKGPKETWSCICQDKKNSLFQLKDANDNIINDPGGVKLHKNFKRNYTDTLLKLSSRELGKVVDYKVGSEEFEKLRDHLMDDFDLGSLQNKVYNMCQETHQPFVKRLVVRIDNIEKMVQLSF